MNATDQRSTLDDLDRAVRRYRRLLAAYPRSFRSEYGDDLVQAFRDLIVLRADTRGLWRRVLIDLAVSAPRERIVDARGAIEPRLPLIVAGTVTLGVIILAGPASGLLVAAGLWILLLLPAFGLARLRRAWVTRRTTSAPIGALVGQGVASFVPGAAFLVLNGPDRGWWMFMMIATTAIVGSAAGIVWGIASLFSKRSSGSGRAEATHHGDEVEPDRRRPLVAAVAGLAVLGLIIGGSYRSYRQSLGPAGDHSVANASAESRALWDAADAADVDEVRRLSATCADPWVKFPVGDGRHNAKGWVEEKAYGLSAAEKAPFEEIRQILRDAMDSWGERCGPDSSP